MNLPEYIEESEHFGERRVWYPLYQHDRQARDDLIKRAGFEVLPHRSLECDPCIHSNKRDLSRLDEVSIKRVDRLEKTIDCSMFDIRNNAQSSGINVAVANAKNDNIEDKEGLYEQFDMGCGSPYACGE